jgi:hypothetical protein
MYTFLSVVFCLDKSPESTLEHCPESAGNIFSLSLAQSLFHANILGFSWLVVAVAVAVAAQQLVNYCQHLPVFAAAHEECSLQYQVQPETHHMTSHKKEMLFM